MREVDRLADLVERVLEGDPWHGPDVVSLLHGVAAHDAAATTVPGAHSIWELVVHMTGWAREVSARLGGAPAGEPEAGDWPVVDDGGEAAWTAALTALVESHRALAAAIRAAGDSVLERPIADHRDAAAGVGLSCYLTLHGLVHHTAYHAGQIALLKRALAAQAR